MRELHEKRVLITGGAKGIGRAIALRFAGAGARIVLADIDEGALPEAAEAVSRAGANADVRTYALDVTDPQQVETVRRTLHDEAGKIDVLINNAGVVFGGAFLDVPLERHLMTYRINVLGLVNMTYAFLPDLISASEGHLVNIASASGMIGLPFGTSYASSKWAVIGFSDSLRLELKLLGHRHVNVTTACPSYVSTGLFEGARPPRTTGMLTPDKISQLILDGVRSNRIYVLSPWLVKATPRLKGLLPTWLFERIAWMTGATSSMQHWRGRGRQG